MSAASKRPTILAAILLVLVLVLVLLCIAKPALLRYSGPSLPDAPAPLPGKNEITGLKVHQDDKGRWMAEYDYFYTGEPVYAMTRVKLLSKEAPPDPSEIPSMAMGYGRPKRGTHHVSVEVQRPPSSNAVTTRSVAVEMHTPKETVARQQVAQVINWPDILTSIREREMAGKSTEQIIEGAVKLIDDGHRESLAEAGLRLQALVSKDPQLDAAYVELARVAMKTNWGPEGRHQAENLLQSALQIEPGSVNAKVLLGYVHAHEARYAKAEALFTEVAKTDTRNLWLWANWGEVLAMQGRIEPAIQKYKEAVTRPQTHDTYDNARLDAYLHLIALLEQRDRLDDAQALYKQRVEEFGCYSAEYARFMLLHRGDTASAITLATKGLKEPCGEVESRQVLGAAHYLVWATSTGPQRQEALNQARIFMPASAQLMYFLASSDRTVAAIQQLKAAGESVDLSDNQRFTALAHALDRRDLAAARRLLKLGASPTAPISFDEMPVAILPVLTADIEAIKLLQQFGVDYTKLRIQGTSAIDYARSTGNRRLLEALEKGGRAL